MTQDIGATFRDLHRPGDPFVLANAWDVGSARVLAGLGAKALATTSSGHAFTLGRPDGGLVSRDEALAHAQDIVAATPLPVSGDFENGFADDPEGVAETIRLAAEVGLAGCSIEDTVPDTRAPYDFDLSVERIKAAVAAARALPGDFVLVARADGILEGSYDCDEAIRRLQAYEAAGADCLYAPLPRTIEDQKRILAAVSKPVNVLIAGPVYTGLSLQDYAAMGAARLSLGSTLARVTHRALVDAASMMLSEGSFDGLSSAMSGGKVDKLLKLGAS